MAANKTSAIREIISFAWNTVGEKSVKSSISLLLYNFTTSLKEKYEVQESQL